MFVKLPYVENIQLSSGLSGAPGFYVFRMNSCYDPNKSGTGYQPTGFDQYSVLY